MHTINVLKQTMDNVIYREQLNDDERNILQWAALFHDISKRSVPTLEGKDHIHPFISGATTLQILEEKGIIELVTEEDRLNFEQLIQLIHESVQPIEDVGMCAREDCCNEVQSHHNLKQIFQMMWQPKEKIWSKPWGERGSFVD